MRSLWCLLLFLSCALISLVEAVGLEQCGAAYAVSSKMPVFQAEEEYASQLSPCAILRAHRKARCSGFSEMICSE